jgi:hypothetical protein
LEIKVNGLRALRLEDNGDSTLDPGTTPDGAPNVIGGSPRNFVGAGIVGATIAGGGATNFNGVTYPNSVLSDFGAVGGGYSNRIAPSAIASTIAGGRFNGIGTNSLVSAIGGGSDNGIGTDSSASVIGGGVDNNIAANSIYSTIAGGVDNEIGTDSDFSVIGGGANNNIAANAHNATIPGGRDNAANGDYSFAAGRQANANHDGSFVWADSQAADFASSGVNQFLIRASGGVGIGTTTPVGQLDVYSAGQCYARFHSANAVNGSVLELRNDSAASPTYVGAINFQTPSSTPGQIGYGDGNGMTFRSGSAERMRITPVGLVGIGTTTPSSALQVIGTVTATAFNPASDRNLKENFARVTPREVLDKVAALPITRWNFKNDPATPHLGPMAQDFHVAFGLGTDDKHIATVDADGVALAAIQGLNQKLTDELKRRDAENAELKQRLENLEQLINHNHRAAK